MATQAIPTTDVLCFPSTLNVSPLNPTPDTKIVTEEHLEALLASTVPTGVISGLGLTYTTGLNVTIQPGTAIIEGKLVNLSVAQVFAIPDSTQRRVYLTIKRTGPVVSSVEVGDYDNTDPGPIDSILLARVDTAGGNITWAYSEERGARPTVSGSYFGDGSSSQLLDIGFTPSFVIAWGESSTSDAAIMSFSAMRTSGYRLVEGEDMSAVGRMGFFVTDTDQSFIKPTHFHYQEQWDFPGNLDFTAGPHTLHVFTISGALPGMLVTVSAPALDAFTSPSFVKYWAEVTEVDTVTVFYENLISGRNPADLDYDFNLITGGETTVVLGNKCGFDTSLTGGKIPVIIEDGFRIGVTAGEDLNTNNERYHYIAFA